MIAVCSVIFRTLFECYTHLHPVRTLPPSPATLACLLHPPFMTSIRARFVLFIPIYLRHIALSVTVPSYPFFMAHFPLFPLTFGCLPFPFLPFLSFFFQQWHFNCFIAFFLRFFGCFVAVSIVVVVVVVVWLSSAALRRVLRHLRNCSCCRLSLASNL